MEKELYSAASNGDVAKLEELLREGTSLYLLETVSFACSRSLLHVATMRGQLHSVDTIVTHYPELARNLDSQNSSPLHMAAAQGHLEIARALKSVAPEVRWWRDWQGMNPIHVAAMNGHVEILELLIDSDRLPAAERLDRGQTVLHLCVKHRQLAAFEFLVEKLGELVRLEDDDGETVVHSAIRFKQVEVIQYMVQNNKLDQLSTKSKGKIFWQVYRERFLDTDSQEIRKIILSNSKIFGDDTAFLSEVSDMTKVVVVLIATMAFQAAVSPPGGVWQDDSSPPRKAGEAVMATNHQKIFKNFKQANTVAFASSLITIFLLTTRLPSKSQFFSVIVLSAMWISLGAIAVSYGASLLVITPNMETESISPLIRIIAIASAGILVLVVVWFLLRKLLIWIKRSKYWPRSGSTTDYEPQAEPIFSYILRILLKYV